MLQVHKRCITWVYICATCNPVQVRLQALDVGAVRVLTSVLAQSAALRFYEE